MKKKKILLALILLVTLIGLMTAISFVSAAPGDTTRVSVASDGTQGNSIYWTGSSSRISADGRYVAFTSIADNLVAGDTNGVFDIFVHDRQTGETKRASVSSSGGQGNGKSLLPSISADGRYVAFVSGASNLVAGDTNYVNDVFVHDRQTGETKRVSVSSSGGQGKNGSSDPDFSADGRYVAFESFASNLVPNDTNDGIDVFVHEVSWDDNGDEFYISGKVVDENNSGIQGVNITVDDSMSTITDAQGNYSILLSNGSHTITLSKQNHFFDPPTREINLTSNLEINFTGYPCIAPSGIDVCNLMPGDILLSRSPRYAGIFSIGGTYFTHAAMYLGFVAAPGGGPETVVPRLAEAQGASDVIEDQVWETPLINNSFWKGDYYLDWAVIRPNVSGSVKQDAIQYIRDKAAEEDVVFDIFASKLGTKKFYCSKLVWRSYKDVPNGRNLEVPMGVGSIKLNYWVTPDDLYYSILTHSSLVEHKLGWNDKLFKLMLWSPAHFMLVDPSGSRIGYDPETGTILNEIPLASYTAPPDSEVETITAVGVGDGWKVVVTGYDSGEYEFEYMDMGLEPRNVLERNITEPGKIDEYDLGGHFIYLPLIIK
jgi:hypothetical protein